MQIYKNLLLGAFVATLFIGCGEGFQASQLTGESEGTEPARETAVEVDESILNNLAPNGVSESTVQIGAFQVIKEVRSSGQSSHPGGAVDSIYNLKVQIRGVGCHSSVSEYRLTGVDMSELRSRRGVSLGASNGTRVILSCTGESCNEMIGVIQKDDRVNSISLTSTGLQPVAIEGNRTIMGRKYRTHRGHGFGLVVPTVEQFNADCAGGDGITSYNGFENDGTTTGTAVDPTGGQNSTTTFNGFENDGSTNTVINPTSGQSPTTTFNGFENDGTFQETQSGWNSNFNGSL